MDEELRDAFKRAATIASVVPEAMQDAAFHRALDSILDSTSSKRQSTRRPSEGSSRASDRARDDATALLNDLERSRMSDVDDEVGALAKALALLRVARRELGVDGLTANEIATILTDKFRSRVSRQAVAEAMDRAGNRVDRRKARGRTSYRIMEAGERWLDTPSENREGASSSGRPQWPRSAARAKGSRSKRSNKLPHPASGKQAAAPVKAGSGSPRRSSRSPKTAVEALITSGWFAQPRGLAAIRQELQESQATRFKATDLSPAMTRLLREKKLKRSKNSAGQYEYQA